MLRTFNLYSLSISVWAVAQLNLTQLTAISDKKLILSRAITKKQQQLGLWLRERQRQQQSASKSINHVPLQRVIKNLKKRIKNKKRNPKKEIIAACLNVRCNSSAMQIKNREWKKQMYEGVSKSDAWEWKWRYPTKKWYDAKYKHN